MRCNPRTPRPRRKTPVLVCRHLGVSSSLLSLVCPIASCLAICYKCVIAKQVAILAGLQLYFTDCTRMKKQAAKAQRKALRARPAKRAHRPVKVPRQAKVSPKPEPKARPLAPAHRTPPPPAKPAPKSPPAAPPDARAIEQQRHYGEATRLFQAHKFERASALFQKAMDGPDRALAHHAQM